MSLADLFAPRIVQIPGETREVRLLDDEAEAQEAAEKRHAALGKAREALAQARAAGVVVARKSKYTPEEAAERRRASGRAYAARRYAANIEQARAESRERRRKRRARWLETIAKN